MENDKWTRHGEQVGGADYADNGGEINRLSQKDLKLHGEKKFKCCS